MPKVHHLWREVLAHILLLLTNLISSEDGLDRQHPWFTVHLPRYLAVMQAGTVATTTALDQEIVEEVSRLTGFPTDQVAESVRGRVQDKVKPYSLYLS